MEPFMRVDQYNYIKNQAQILINAHASVNDTIVLNALKSLTSDKVNNLFSDITEEQRDRLKPVSSIKDSSDADKVLSDLKPYVFPFKKLSDQSIKKLFPKAKKLKTPNFDVIDLTEISYLGWDDLGSNRKFIITQYEDKLVGLNGTFTPLNKKGICTFCNKHAEIGMFMTKTKGTELGTFISRGNYICQDSQKCNHNLTSLDNLHEFIQLVKS